MHSLRSISHRVFILYAILFNVKLAGCNPITNSNLSDRVREFSSKSDVNTTTVKTLQKGELGGYTNFSPVRNPIHFKDVSDSALSSSSYSRGLLHHEHPGYALHDYEESPPYGYEYHVQDTGHHGFVHHVPDHGYHGGHHHVNCHHKNYDHAVAAKAFLWPIAGIALLGAAAALVSNPVLLQLGVVSGRRKRRDTEENFDTESQTEPSWLKKVEDEIFDRDSRTRWRLNKIKKGNKSNELSKKNTDTLHTDDNFKPFKVYSVKQGALFNRLVVHPTVQSPVDVTTDIPRRFSERKSINEKNLVPVRLIFKENI